MTTSGTGRNQDEDRARITEGRPEERHPAQSRACIDTGRVVSLGTFSAPDRRKRGGSGRATGDVRRPVAADVLPLGQGAPGSRGFAGRADAACPRRRGSGARSGATRARRRRRQALSSYVTRARVADLTRARVATGFLG